MSNLPTVAELVPADTLKREMAKVTAFLRRRRTYVRKRSYLCYGGPFNGGSLHLSTGSTCKFVVGEHRGRYVLAPMDAYGKLTANAVPAEALAVDPEPVYEARLGLVWAPEVRS